MVVLIAGGAGFLGKHLAARLLKLGNDVVIADNFCTSRADDPDLAKLVNDGAQVIHIDVSEDEQVRSLVTTVRRAGRFVLDRVYHLASPASPKHYGWMPTRTLLVNSQGTHNLLWIARRAENARLLFASTSEVYGDPQVHPQPESYWGHVNPVGPRSCYDEAKRFGEALCMAAVSEYQQDIRIARLFNTYGPGLQEGDGRVVSNFIVQALSHMNLSIHGTGEQTRSLCYVDDTIDGLVRLMETDSVGAAPVNLGNPAEISVIDLAKRIIEKTRSTSQIEYGKPWPDDPARRRPVIDRAYQLLGWSPKIGLEDGLQRTIEWFRKRLNA